MEVLGGDWRELIAKLEEVEKLHSNDWLVKPDASRVPILVSHHFDYNPGASEDSSTVFHRECIVWSDVGDSDSQANWQLLLGRPRFRLETSDRSARVRYWSARVQ